MEDNESSLEWRVNKHKHLLAPSPGTFSFSFMDTNDRAHRDSFFCPCNSFRIYQSAVYVTYATKGSIMVCSVIPWKSDFAGSQPAASSETLEFMVIYS